MYDDSILDLYDESEIDRMGMWIDHERDYNFTYAGLRQVLDKYLVQDRSTNEIFETPQFMYMMIAATIFANYPKETRLTYVKKYYNAISLFRINIPTPVMAGVRTPIRQFASCVLVDSDDTLPSIFSSDMAIVDMSLKGRALVSMLGVFVALTAASVVEKFNILVLYPFSKSSRQLSGAVLKTALEEEVQRYTSLFGTKK